jgi:hypothetical protein
VYSVEYTDIPRVFFMTHRVSYCVFTYVIQGHCCAFGHSCTNMISDHCCVLGHCRIKVIPGYCCVFGHYCTNVIPGHCHTTVCSNNDTYSPSVQQWDPLYLLVQQWVPRVGSPVDPIAAKVRHADVGGPIKYFLLMLDAAVLKCGHCGCMRPPDNVGVATRKFQ